MGATSKVCHVILRVWEIICSIIVLGLVAHFVNRINDAGVSNDSRVIYTLVVASFSTLYAIIFIPPIRYGFLGFPVDFCLFIMWMVAFGLLANRTIGNTCGSFWYWSYWGYYWGGWWRNPIGINGPGSIGWSGCSQWRTVLAFSFMVSITYLLSFILGCIVIVDYYKGDKTTSNGTRSAPVVSQPSRQGQPEVAQHGYQQPGYQQPGYQQPGYQPATTGYNPAYSTGAPSDPGAPPAAVNV